MPVIVVEKEMNAPLEKVFLSWADEYADIYKFNPLIRSSHLLEESPVEKGEGALRQCDLNDGQHWVREKIVQQVENKKLIVSVVSTSLSMERIILTVLFEPVGEGKTEVTLQLNFTPNMGVLSALVAPFMGMKLKAMLGELLEGNAAYIERGVLANPEK